LRGATPGTGNGVPGMEPARRILIGQAGAWIEVDDIQASAHTHQR
jgi:hypothetical protein